MAAATTAINAATLEVWVVPQCASAAVLFSHVFNADITITASITSDSVCWRKKRARKKIKKANAPDFHVVVMTHHSYFGGHFWSGENATIIKSTQIHFFIQKHGSPRSDKNKNTEDH